MSISAQYHQLNDEAHYAYVTKKYAPNYEYNNQLYHYSNHEHVYRTIDGVGNNAYHPEWGSAGEQLYRYAPPDYGDGENTMAGNDRPSAREISNEIFHQEYSTQNSHQAADMFWQWGQFIDHDIDLTHTGMTEFEPIDIPNGDPYFDPYYTGTQTMPFDRSTYDPSTGHSGVPREQLNDITSFIDASNVYGSDADRQNFLRSHVDGKLKTSDGDLLPFNDGTQDNAGGPDPSLFVAGDVRANEQTGLTAMHTLFVREHNQWADIIRGKEPWLSDEDIYQKAKVMVESEIQAITFNEFLPILLGNYAIPDYDGYDPYVNPSIANEFSTGAYRLGHTLLSSTLLRVDESGNESKYGHLSLRDAFFDPTNITDEGGIDEVLRGLAMSYSEEVDAKLVDDVRNFLFGPPGAGGFDLASLNIQRGRDHGLADFNTVRQAYGLAPIYAFSDLTDDVDLQYKLHHLYGDVNNIDLWVGGLIETPYHDSMLGETFHTIVLDQFLRLRAGDKFWYENRLSEYDIEMINSTSLSDIIVRNTDTMYLQDDAMIYYNRTMGTDGKDHLYGTDENDLMMGLNGNDVIVGHDGNDDIFGGYGNDRLYGKDGNDNLYGEHGRDKLVGGHGNDKLDGGAGNDKLYGQSGHDNLYGGDGHDTLYGGGHDDYLYGGKGNDFMKGGRGDDHLWGGEHNDIVVGGSGRDHLYGENGDDRLHGESGYDRLYGGDGDDLLVGGDGYDVLYGGNGNDKLYGGDYKDVLIGGTGVDWLKGGYGGDIFVFGRYNGDDHIKDFEKNDKIDLRQYGLSENELETKIHDYGDDTLILLGHNSITLHDTNVDDLNMNQFIL